MSKLETNQVDPATGTTLTLGTSGDTVALGTGVLQSNMLYPAFEAYLSANQTSFPDLTYTKLLCNAEVYDTDGDYDNSSNYRFTPTTAGKYFAYGQIKIEAGGGNDDAKSLGIKIYKNGSAITNVERQSLFNLGYQNSPSISISSVIDMNGSSDYLELYGSLNSVSNSSANIGIANNCFFGSYRIGT